MVPFLVTDRDEISNFYRVPSMDAHYQDSVHLAKRFKSRFLEIDQLETMVAMFVNIYGQNEQSV